MNKLIVEHKKQKDKNDNHNSSNMVSHVAELLKFKSTNKELEFDGYQSILSHYFRHLYQTIEYSDIQTILTYEEKYRYIKTLRAQLTTFELIMVFYSLFSPYSYKWEPCLKNVDFHNVQDVSAYINLFKPGTYDINRQLITKYQFLKNIIIPISNDISIKEFFPMIEYELNHELKASELKNVLTTPERTKLKQKYK